MPIDDDNDEDFARMFEESLVEPISYTEGQRVEGTIIAIGRDAAFVDVGGKGEATIELDELADEDGEIDVEVGDIVQAVVVSTAGGLKLSLKLARRAVNREQLAEAYRAGLPVEGRVEKAIKGGFEVKIGGQRGFCPISQIDSAFTEDPSIHEGQVYPFRITEFAADGKNIVVSRRALLEEEERERADEIRRTIVPGAVLAGRVVTLREYGAFVDLGGGIQGLLHVSDMGWGRVSDASKVVRPGDAVTVMVLRVDDEQGRISLGLKQLEADPWSQADDTYEVGQRLMGRVTRLADFGAFIELEPGVEGLAHASTFPPEKTRDAWKQRVPVGSNVAVEILNFDPERKRIGVAVIDEASARLPESRVDLSPGARLTGKVERHEDYGVFVFLAPGRTGLVPLAETGFDRGVDLRKALPMGSDIEVVVLEVEPSSGRIRLSRRAVLQAEEQREARAYAERQEPEPDDHFGSLADKLRDAMQRRKS